MLVINRKDGESILIYPSLDVDPDMTVKELFSLPIRIKVYSNQNETKVCIEAPRTLNVTKEELEPV